MKTKIKMLRKSQRMTQDDLANAIGATKRMVSSWERDEAEISLEWACAVADVFNCTLDELAGRDFNPGGYPDKRQESMNRSYSELSDSDKETAAWLVNELAHKQRIGKFQSDKGQGVA